MRPQDVHSPAPDPKGGSVTSRRRSALGADRRLFNLRVEEFQPARTGGSWAAARAQLNALPAQKDKVLQALVDHYKRLAIWAHERVQRCAATADIQAHCDAEDEVDADLLTVELKN